MDSQILAIREKLKNKLDPMRYEHSISVSYTCMNLAMRYGYDIDKAELAGLLHDCAKRYMDQIIIQKCAKHKIEITEDELLAPAVLHAKYGAWLASNKFGVTDPEILSAIACHTTGKPDMKCLDLILYIADYIEPRRYKASNLTEMRRMAYVNLEDTAFEILNSTLVYLKGKGGYIDSMTLKAYEYYQALRNEQKGVNTI
ncbi:MAG: bis(5'-nucleosyl)-tetraphosphatase (symmetrical) YqeK [Clostridiaceae bacterium]|nr:bis(5'-nucleosyl)-tetraphosphatase (symmetrical) YqeK [Clostridiaceae bacterium]